MELQYSFYLMLSLPVFVFVSVLTVLSIVVPQRIFFFFACFFFESITCLKDIFKAPSIPSRISCQRLGFLFFFSPFLLSYDKTFFNVRNCFYVFFPSFENYSYEVVPMSIWLGQTLFARALWEI